ncbi:MAG: type II toxin-antitoxin system Phd/YefM family antitoxin [Ancrocorticia populi]|uniref:type II toxin-antitoxin system Phd/YefM family antitoxin n=1 Tax=Ancrocorticia populi TaxID=2175228 RepID=UPI003F908947
METISHRELRNNSAAILRRVESGESFRVTNSGRSAAIIRPPQESAIDELITEGAARPAQADLSNLSKVRQLLAEHVGTSRRTSEMIKDARGRW